MNIYTTNNNILPIRIGIPKYNINYTVGWKYIWRHICNVIKQVTKANDLIIFEISPPPPSSIDTSNNLSNTIIHYNDLSQCIYKYNNYHKFTLLQVTSIYYACVANLRE